MAMQRPPPIAFPVFTVSRSYRIKVNPSRLTETSSDNHDSVKQNKLVFRKSESVFIKTDSSSTLFHNERTFDKIKASKGSLLPRLLTRFLIPPLDPLFRRILFLSKCSGIKSRSGEIGIFDGICHRLRCRVYVIKPQVVECESAGMSPHAQTG